jgi:alkanesulfonate monooxygenase SsuD/methylene tetrahydromethanopterin reductase-like flavin-dependent oxidoreductase (luciferase family)
MDGSTTCLARRLNDICSSSDKTSTVRFGTSIVPTYPRHPLVLAQQALALYDIAPSRVRLGIGPSHRFIIEDMYGLQQRTPLAHLREYVEILHAALWEGKVNHHGDFYNVAATLPRKPQIPVLISTLSEKAFQLAGRIADGALSWGMSCSIFASYWNSGPTYVSSCCWKISASDGGTCFSGTKRG